MKFNTGIYQIVNLVNGKKYIGSSTTLHKRKNKHFLELKKNIHHNNHLQRSYNKYGKENFKFEIIMHCCIEDLIFFEQKHIDKYNFDKELYNLAPKAGNCLGLKHTNKTKEKISKIHKGKKISKETRAKMSKSRKGRKVTQKQIEAIKKAHTGKIVSKETRDKLRQANLGKKHSKESRKKMSETHKKMIPTDQQLKNIMCTKYWEGKTGIDHHSSKPVYQIEINTNKIIQKWDSISCAQNELKINHISCVCNKTRKTAGGFKWEFVK